MNIVEQVARMLDCEGAYCKIAYPDTSDTSEPIPFTVRQKYYQAKYEHMAVEIVKLLDNTSPRAIKADLIEFEKQGWRRLGVPIDDPRLKETADEIINAKYGIHQA